MSVPANQQYNMEEALYAIVPAEIRDKELNLSLQWLVQLKDNAKLTFVRSKRYGGWENENITEVEKDIVKELLWLYSKNADIGVKFKNSPAQAEFVLNICIDPAYNLPEDIRLCATALKANFESFNWGITEESNDEAEVETSDANQRSKKRKYSASKSNRGEASGGSAPQGVYMVAPNSHRVYGSNGIMHDIQISKGGAKMAYRIAPAYNSRDFRVFGHNGLTIGDCWAKQVAACRDGAHGAPVAGISGTATEGVYSIIVSGMYADIDYDGGDQLYYAAADAHNTQAATADQSNSGTKSLLRSLATKTPIRVLRKSSSKWNKAPRAGLRYDGLYTITSMEEKSNDLGGKYLRFKLEREAGQPTIAVNRPSPSEVRQIEKAKDGY